MKKIVITILALCSILYAEGYGYGYDIPSDRRITWEGNVGVKGGIPNRTAEIDCVANYGVPTNNSTPAQSAINNCLNGISNEQVAYLPAGTYLITGSINIPSYKTLRGAGVGVTTIRANSNFGNYLSSGLITMSGGYTNRASTTVVNITSMTQGSPAVVLADAGAFSVGDYMFIDVLNGSWTSTSESCGVYGGGQSRCFDVMHKITGKVGNTLTIDPPVVHPSYQSDSPQAVRVSHSMRTRAGVENLSIKNDTGVTSGSNNVNVFMQGTSECWVKNVKIERCGRYCLETFFDNYRIELRDSMITGCVNPVPSDYCYGTAYYHTSFGLIENNIYQSTSEGPIIGGSSGNVIAFNYGNDVSREDSSASGWYMGGDWSHLVHSSYNLWEGQFAEGIMLDNIHGSSGHQTIFRSRYSARKPGDLCMGSTCNFAYAIALGRYQYFHNIVGNVLGTSGYTTKYDEASFGSGDYNIYSTGYDGGSGSQDSTVLSTLLRHYNFNYYTNTIKNCNDPGEPGCQGGSTDTSIPDSFYRSSKPNWWCNETPWPPIGPDVSGYVNDIPAKRRFNGLACTTSSGGGGGGGGQLTPMPPVILNIQ